MDSFLKYFYNSTVVPPSCGPSHERPPPLSSRISLALTHFNAKLPPAAGQFLFPASGQCYHV